MLIFVNFGLSLLYFPSLLILEEERERRQEQAGEYTAPNRAARTNRLLGLQELHRQIWENRLSLLTAFGVSVLLATPFALSLAPSSDSTFTFAPDPQMTAIVARANGGEPSLFSAAPGSNYSNHAPRTLPFAAAISSNATERYFELLGAGYPPPAAEWAGFTYGLWLALFLLFDCPMLVALACVIHTGVPFFMLAVPEHSLIPASYISAIVMAGCFAGLAGLTEGFFTIFLCDFAAELQVLLGELLGMYVAVACVLMLLPVLRACPLFQFSASICWISWCDLALY